MLRERFVVGGVGILVRNGNVNCEFWERFVFCRIDWMMDFECWRVCLNVVWCVGRWWLSSEVVVKGVVGGGDGFW